MSFVFGTAEKQFVTDAVFHFQYQYHNTQIRNWIAFKFGTH